MHIAILEDDPAQAKMLHAWLTNIGHACSIFSLGRKLLPALKQETYDLLILDWNVPDLTGIKILAWVRDNLEWRIPVMFITCRHSETDIVDALESGADDYMKKPVTQFETLARVAALERRITGSSVEDTTLACEPYMLDKQAGTVTYIDEEIRLTRKEFDLALLFFRNIGQLLSRDYILDNVWGRHAGLRTRTVDMHVSRLRKKMEIRPENGWKLTSVYQHGYRLEKTQPIGR